MRFTNYCSNNKTKHAVTNAITKKMNPFPYATHLIPFAAENAEKL